MYLYTKQQIPATFVAGILVVVELTNIPSDNPSNNKSKSINHNDFILYCKI